MENLFTTGRTSQCGETQREARSSAVTAQNHSIAYTPWITDVRAGKDLIFNFNINATQPQPDRTDDTNAVSPKTEGNIQRCQAELKSYLENTTKRLFQGTKDDGSSTLLNKIYTELYITNGGGGDVNNEHEIIQLECRRCLSEEKQIQLNDIFKPLSDEENLPQRVLMNGIAGIGKTVAVQKFTQDWAAGKANQIIQFIFPITFKDLNSIKDIDDWSLMKLIGYYFKEVKDLAASDYSSSIVLFIFDGLDECKLPLDFENNKMCRSVTETATVDVLLTNLISGKLLHKARIWITSRTAAATKIPPYLLYRVTEVGGFKDKQKEEYFQKNFSDTEYQKFHKHLQSKPMRSPNIMCHIPVFCCILTTALQSFLTHNGELPEMVTEMYTHFVIYQTKLKHQKRYQEGEKDKDRIMKIGKLAFEGLEKGKTNFDEKDLKSCEIDLKQAAIYSVFFTQTIKKEDGLYKQEIYSFIHLSVQEFFAALYVLETFLNSGENLLRRQTDPKSMKVASEKGKPPIFLLHKNAVYMALANDSGQWDMFLRFLFGLSQNKNQKLLQRELRFEERRPQNTQETKIYIQETIKELSNPDKYINLFHCLNELGDQQLNNEHSRRCLSEERKFSFHLISFRNLFRTCKIKKRESSYKQVDCKKKAGSTYNGKHKQKKLSNTRWLGLHNRTGVRRSTNREF